MVNILNTNLREYDQVGRYGGEEFVVILPSTDKDSAWGVAERIRASLQYHPAQVDAELDISMTVSIGITEFRHDGSDGRDRHEYFNTSVLPPPSATPRSTACISSGSEPRKP